MAKRDILRYFDDINSAYNDCTKYDTLSNLLDELEQEPCEDCISRQAVIERIKREEKVLYTPKGMNCLIRAINELPSINSQEPKPMEKFENAKDHIFKLAGDYKCWDNRLTQDEALELCHILEQEPKTGHWIETVNRGYADVDGNNIILYQEMCDRCKCLSYFRKSGGLLIGAKYCPNCNTKMKSEGGVRDEANNN